MIVKDKTIVVIGAGIVGVSTAIWLQRDGHKVILIDKGPPTVGASYGNGGVIVPSGIIPINSPGLIKNAPSMLLNQDSPLFLNWTYVPRMMPWLIGYSRRANRTDAGNVAKILRTLVIDSVSQHRALAEGTGAEKWIVDSDYIFIYQDRGMFNKDRFAWNTRRDQGIRWDEFNQDSLKEYDPAFCGTGKFGIRLKNHARITDPGRYVQDLTKHFCAKGGQLLATTAKHFNFTGNRLSAVVTDSGEIECSKAIIASGVWSKEITESCGIKVPMESERGYHIDLINPSEKPRAAMMLTAGKFVLTPMSGRIRCAGIVEFGGVNAPASKAPLKLLKSKLAQTCPELKYERIEEWMGHRPAPIDSIPLVGPLSKTPDIYAAFGHHHIGLTAGPKTGRIVADCIAGRDPIIPIEKINPSRFMS